MRENGQSAGVGLAREVPVSLVRSQTSQRYYSDRQNAHERLCPKDRKLLCICNSSQERVLSGEQEIGYVGILHAEWECLGLKR
jgi:hypothetical protein